MRNDTSEGLKFDLELCLFEYEGTASTLVDWLISLA